MVIFRAILGLASLTLGRKLFWLFTAIMGFTAAMSLTTGQFSGQPEWLTIVIALAAGMVGALIAILVRWLGVGLAGFLGGGYLLTTLLAMVGVSGGRLDWVLFVVGGVVGAIVFVTLFDWALIVISSLAGAVILIQAVELARPFNILVVIVLAVVGIGVQSRMLDEE